jgi:hypothetical protein
VSQSLKRAISIRQGDAELGLISIAVIPTSCLGGVS